MGTVLEAWGVLSGRQTAYLLVGREWRQERSWGSVRYVRWSVRDVGWRGAVNRDSIRVVARVEGEGLWVERCVCDVASHAAKFPDGWTALGEGGEL